MGTASIMDRAVNAMDASPNLQVRFTYKGKYMEAFVNLETKKEATKYIYEKYPGARIEEVRRGRGGELVR